jgi:hypothetical protein
VGDSQAVQRRGQVNKLTIKINIKSGDFIVAILAHRTNCGNVVLESVSWHRPKTRKLLIFLKTCREQSQAIPLVNLDRSKAWIRRAVVDDRHAILLALVRPSRGPAKNPHVIAGASTVLTQIEFDRLALMHLARRLQSMPVQARRRTHWQ